MPWNTPTLTDLRKINRDALAAALETDRLLPKSPARILSDQNAGDAYLNLLYLDWQSRQYLPDTAESEWLDRHGQIWLGGRKAATYASGPALVSGDNGYVLPTGSELVFESGLAYATTEDVVLTTAGVPVDVAALMAGAVGNRESGDTLGFVAAIPGVTANATAIAITGGVDTETDDELRTRVLLRIRKTPMGGDADDYVQWTLAVPGVTRAWSSPNGMGVGTVVVRFLCDDLRAGSGGFPNGDDLAAVRAYLDTVRPVCVRDFFVEAPIRQPLSMTIRNLSRDTPATRSAIEKAVRDMLFDRAAPGQTIYRSWTDEAVSGALGEDHHDLDFDNAVMPSAGHFAVLQNIFYA